MIALGVLETGKTVFNNQRYPFHATDVSPYGSHRTMFRHTALTAHIFSGRFLPYLPILPSPICRGCCWCHRPPPQPLPVFAPTPDRNTKSPDAESEYPTTLTHAGNRFLQEMCTQLERRSRQLDTARQHFHVTNGLQPNIFVLVVRQCAARAPTLIIHRHYPRNEHQLETKATRRPVDNV